MGALSRLVVKALPCHTVDPGSVPGVPSRDIAGILQITAKYARTLMMWERQVQLTKINTAFIFIRIVTTVVVAITFQRRGDASVVVAGPLRGGTCTCERRDRH